MKIHSPFLFLVWLFSNAVFAAPDEIHWTFRGPTSVTFDWRGSTAENTIRYGTVSGSYGAPLTAAAPNPVPTSSEGPFWEITLTDLQANTLYYYSIARSPEHTFRTPQFARNADFTVYAVGDIGSTRVYPKARSVHNIMADIYGNGFPDFVLIVGDLSYGDVDRQLDVDLHFNDVMLWSQDAAYMPAWGNHEWDTSQMLPDNFYNYLGRFALPHGFSSPGTSAVYHYSPGEDWYWFDYGHARFIAYPQDYNTETLAAWNQRVQNLMSSAQTAQRIKFIVTFGHSPAYSSSGSVNNVLKGYLDKLAQTYPKYALNLCGHHHHYERSDPAQTFGVTHLVVGTGHTNTSTFSNEQPSWSVFRIRQSGALKLHFVNNATDTYIEGQFVCAPASSFCKADGTVLDSFKIGKQQKLKPSEYRQIHKKHVLNRKD